MTTSTVLKKLSMATAGAVFIGLAVVSKAQAAAVAPSFSSFYSLTDLGSVPQLPPAYGGLTFKAGDPNTLLIGGLAGSPDAGIYSVGVTRSSDNHITGFGAASLFAKSPGLGGGGIDAGLAYNPIKDVLFYTSYPDNSIGQIKPGSSGPDKQINLNSLGIASSTGSLTFVPEGFAGAGRLKITSYTANIFYDTTITPHGSGTYDIAAPSRSINLSGGLDGLIYVKAGNPGFSTDSLLVAEYDTNTVSAYTIDANGDPIAATRQDFLTGMSFHSPTALSGVIGSTIDPVTGDFLFSTFFEDYPSQSKIFEVRSFTQPTPVPEPKAGAVASLAVLGLGLLLKKKVTSSSKRNGTSLF